MTDIIENDLIVVGGGPGGYAAAFHAADRGQNVTLINDMPKPGGTCLHVGCIPSKALLHLAKLIEQAKAASKFGVTFGDPKIDIEKVRKHWHGVVKKMSDALVFLCKKRNVEHVSARAKLLDNQTLELSDGTKRRFKTCVLATGSSPVVPGPLKIDSPRLMTSSEALELEDVPCSLLVIGGGYIGLEMGSVYAALGCKVTVVEMLPNLLPGADTDLVRPLHQKLIKRFENIYLKTQILKLEEKKKGIRAHVKGETINETTMDFDRVLIAVGRRPNSGDLGLDNTKIEIDDKGFIKINEQCQTAEPNIYAIGDVAGQPMLAHKASYEGKIAAEVIAGENVAIDYRAVPAVVFTDPELAWTGLTELEAKEKEIRNKVVRFPWGASGRATTMGLEEGITKLLVEPESERILGVGIVGAEAGELIAEATLAIEMGATIRDLTLTIHAHPTLSETLMEAADFYHGESVHLPPKK